jgi:fibronectin-binding autotransporter adhesin
MPFYEALRANRDLLKATCLASALLSLFFSTRPCFAANLPGNTWDGEASSLWSDGHNFDGQGSQPNPNDLTNIIMSGSTRITNTVDNGSTVNLLSLTFTNVGSGNFVIGGNTLTNGSGGILNVRSGTQFISNRIEMSASQTWTANNGTLVLFGTVSNQGNQLTLGGTANLRFDGSIDGSGGILKNGTGTNFFNAATGFTGNLTNSAGVLVISANNALGTTAGKTVVTSGGALAFSNAINYSTAEALEITGSGINGTGVINNWGGTNTFAGGITLNGNSTIGAEADKLTLSGNIVNGGFLLTVTNPSTANITASGAISGTGGIMKTGGGTLVLSGANTLSGVITNSAGTIESQSATGLGTGNMFLNGGVLKISTVDQSYNQIFTIASSTTNDVAAGITMRLANSANQLTGSGTLVKTGAGTLVLSNANDITGGIRIDAGRIQATDSSLGTGTLTFNGGDIFVAGSGSEVLTISNSVSVLANSSLIGTNGNDVVFATKDFTGTAGVTLFMTNASATASRLIRFTSNSFVFASDIQLDDSDRIRFENASGTNTFTGVIKGSGNQTNPGISMTGGGALMLSNANTYTASTLITNGTIIVARADALGTAAQGTFVSNSGTLAFLGGISYTTAESVQISSAGLSGQGAINNIGGTNSFAGVITLKQNATIGTALDQLTLTGTITNSSFLLTITNAGNSTLVLNGVLGANAGSGGLVHNGTGTLLLGNSNTFTGPITNQAGTIIIAATNALGSGASTVVINSGATLGLQGGIGFTNAGNVVQIAGTGQGGVGAIENISGTNSFAKTISLTSDSTISTIADKLTLSGGITNGASFLTVTNVGSSTLVLSGDFGVNAGTGGLIHSGTGTLTLAASNAFSGAVTNLAGILDISHANGLGSTSKVSVQGGTLLFNTGVTNTGAALSLGGGDVQEVDQNISLGSLSVNASSTIHLNSGGTSGSLRFADGTNTIGAGAMLTIYGWNYNSVTDSGSDDLIFFTSSTFESASFLNNITFFGLGAGARILSTGELVPVTPEPSTWITGFSAGILMVSSLRFRLKKMFQK